MDKAKEERKRIDGLKMLIWIRALNVTWSDKIKNEKAFRRI